MKILSTPTAPCKCGGHAVLTTAPGMASIKCSRNCGKSAVLAKTRIAAIKKWSRLQAEAEERQCKQ